MKSPTRRIHLLPDAVIEKIAAGEVIERPASVLKELVENALDADAAKIDICIEDAGFGTILVSDNGCGMEKIDLEKSLVRHATSKISTADDLFAVRSFGFRGEALASIAAVSRFSISTSPDNSGNGFVLSSEHPHALHAAHKQGTTVISRDLFYNVPARKKFMKSRLSERMALVRMLEQIVVSFPAVHFTAIIEGKTVLDTPAVGSVRGRIAQIAGVEFAKKLIECQGSTSGIDAAIFVSPASDAGTRPRHQNTYVNLRRIDSDPVIFSIREAFSRFTQSQFKPSFFCLLSVDPARVDVNVHPTKQKIKFDDEKALFSFVFATVKNEMGKHVMAVPQHTGQPSGDMTNTVPWSRPVPRDIQAAHEPDHTYGNLKEQPTGLPVDGPADGEQTVLPFVVPFYGPQKKLESDDDESIQLSHSQPVEPWGLIPCFQVHGLFILSSIKDGILLIDQHAAHERVLYEQALDDLNGNGAASQQLLFPVVMELSISEKAVIESGFDFFNAFGFSIGDFGGNTIAVSAIPAFMKAAQAEEAVRGIIKYCIEGDGSLLIMETEKRFAAAFACGSAIKAGQKLSNEEMNALLNSLFATKNPYVCPHGRPTVIRISVAELSRRFLR